MLNQALFVPRLLSLLTEPGYLHRAIAVGLRVAAALSVLLGLITLFDIIKLTLDLPPAKILGGVFLLLSYTIALYVVAHLLIRRAAAVDDLTSGSYPVLPAAPLLFRLAGEAYAGFVIPLAAGSALFMWFTNQGLGRVLGSTAQWLPAVADANFISGIKLLVFGSLQALALLVVSYVVADLLALFLDKAGISEPRRKAA
jgi:hypothetical protein